MSHRISNDFTSTIAGSVFTKGGEERIKPPVGHEFVGFTTLADTVLYSKPDFTYPSGETFYERKDFMQVETGSIIAYYSRTTPKTKVKKILNEFTGAAAAYSLRELSNEVDNIVRVRRDLDSSERDFTAAEVSNGTLTDFCNFVNDLPASYDTGADRAYSLRYVYKGYSGNVVRVRRTSDNTEQDFDPTGITNGALESFVGSGNNGFVTTWYDQTGNGNDATQTSGSAQPKIVDSGSLILESGKATIEFDGSSHYFDIDDLDSSENISVFMAFKPDTNNDDSQIYNMIEASPGSGDRYAVAAGQGGLGTSAVFGSRYYSLDGSVNVDTTGIAIPATLELFLMTNIYQAVGSDNDFYLDGTQGATADSARLSTSGSAIGGNNFGSNLFDGKISEMIVYLTNRETDREPIEANINNYYSAFTATTNGFVTSWYDQSGNGNTATQTSASAQGKIVDAGSLVTINSKPAIQSSGAEYMDFTATTTVGFSSKSIFAVTSFEQTDTVDRFLCSESSDLSNESQILTGGLADNRVTFATQSSGTNYNSDYIIMAQDDLSLLTGIFDGSSTEIYLDGVLGTGTSYKSHSNAIPASGYLWSKNGTANFWIGKHCEIIIYTTDESSNQSNIENNITDHYSI